MTLQAKPKDLDGPKPKLEAQLRDAIRAKLDSRYTADARWYRPFVLLDLGSGVLTVRGG